MMNGMIACLMLFPSSDDLPVGRHPQALSVDHFPDQLHAFVFRNWNLVDPSRMAQVVGATTEQVSALAHSMGLPAARAIPPEYHERLYITVLRRNWHLLPYDQLLTLLNMRAAELAHRLKEDDFLFIKLGNLKPRVEPLRYAPPSEAASRRAAEIKALIQHHFGKALEDPGTPRLNFLREFATAGTMPARTEVRQTMPRFLHSYCATFGDSLIDEKLDPFPEGLLYQLSLLGVNGVWLHVTLADLAPGGADFPEFGVGHEKRLANLKKLVEKARRYGIDLYLYLNEPRARPRSFFARRPEMAGVASQDFVCMCTSDSRVIRWLEQATAHVFRAVPQLGGVFTITASENQTNCAWGGNASSCPRCSKRSQAEIVAEVNMAIERGVHSISPQAKVIVWDWGWNHHRDGREHIRLHRGKFWIQSVSEWDTPYERAGVKGKVGEYSISVVGPGPRAQQHWAEAKKMWHATSAKVQLGTTWELGSVPYLPVGDLLAEHCLRLKQAGTDGMMLSWSLGGYPSPNLRIAQRVLEGTTRDKEALLRQVCEETYGSRAGPSVRQAWASFSQAFLKYPYCSSVLYNGPQHFGPANLLYGQPTRYGSTMVGFPYDDVKAWCGPYSSEQMASLFESLCATWKEGEAHLEQAERAATDQHRAMIARELRLARAIRLHFQSSAKQIRFYTWRNQLPHNLTIEQRKQRIDSMKQLCNEELELAKQLYPITKADSRIGFESSNQYYYVPHDLVEKVINCDWLIRHIN